MFTNLAIERGPHIVLLVLIIFHYYPLLKFSQIYIYIYRYAIQREPHIVGQNREISPVEVRSALHGSHHRSTGGVGSMSLGRGHGKP